MLARGHACAATGIWDSFPIPTGRVKATRAWKCRPPIIARPPRPSTRSLKALANPIQAFHKYTFRGISGEMGGLLSRADERSPSGDMEHPGAWNARVHGTVQDTEQSVQRKGQHALRSGYAGPWWRRVRDTGTKRNGKEAISKSIQTVLLYTTRSCIRDLDMLAPCTPAARWGEPRNCKRSKGS